METLPSYRRSGRARHQAVAARADAEAAGADSEISNSSARTGSGRRPAKRSRDACKRVKLQWMSHEDSKLADLVSRHGAQNWNIIAAELDGRSSKNCRLRWCNQLNPTLNKAPFSAWEDAVVYHGFKTHGTRWALIAKMLHGRTDNSVKNRWNCALKRREELDIHIENDFISSAKSLEDLLAAGPFVRQDHKADTADAQPPALDSPSSPRTNTKGDESGWEQLSRQEDSPCAVAPERSASSAVGSFLALCTANMEMATDHRQTSHPAAAVADFTGGQSSADEPFLWATTSATADEQDEPFPSRGSSSGLGSFGGWPPSWHITEPAAPPHPGPVMAAHPPPPPHDEQLSCLPWLASNEAAGGAGWNIDATMMQQQFQQQLQPQASYCAHSSMDDADDCLHLLFEESSAGLHLGGMRAAPSPAASSYGNRPPSHPCVQEGQLACAGLVYGPSTIPLEEFYASWGTF